MTQQGSALAPITTRVESAMVSRIDRLVARMAARLPRGAGSLTRSDALRAAVERGVAALEAELQEGGASGAKP